MFSIETKRELQKGNPEAYKEVFRLLYPRLKGYCKLFVPNESEVEDLIQECFITLKIFPVPVGITPEHGQKNCFTCTFSPSVP
ncbi:RNA polymerase sigma factor [Mariniphaga sp.]|uniref:RNA polymerase sigma factor n=1 Tax=Mariniphaga sp. TaxID=1954475 RepID=UPI003569DC84